VRPVREADIEAHLVKRVKEAGGIAYKFTSPQRRSVPDRLVLMPGGQVWFAELKAPGAKPTEAQAREHERLRSMGFTVEVVDDKGLIDIWAKQGAL